MGCEGARYGILDEFLAGLSPSREVPLPESEVVGDADARRCEAASKRFFKKRLGMCQLQVAANDADIVAQLMRETLQGSRWSRRALAQGRKEIVPSAINLNGQNHDARHPGVGRSPGSNALQFSRHFFDYRYPSVPNPPEQLPTANECPPPLTLDSEVAPSHVLADECRSPTHQAGYFGDG